VSISSTNARVAADEGSIATLSIGVTSINSRMTADESTITSLGGAIGSINTRVLGDEGTLSAHGTSITSLSTAVVSVNTRAVTDENSISSLGVRFSVDESTLTSVSTAIVSVGTRLGTDEGSIVSLNTAVGTVNTAVTSVNTRIGNDEATITSHTTSITSFGTRFTGDESTTTYNAASLTTLVVNYVNSLNSRAGTDESAISTHTSQITLIRPNDAYLTMSHYRYISTNYLYTQTYYQSYRVLYNYFYGCCYYGWNYYGTGGYFPTFTTVNSYSQYFQMDFSGDFTHLVSGQNLVFRMCFEWSDPGSAGATGYYSGGIYGPPGPLINVGLTIAGNWKTRAQCTGYYNYQYAGVYASYPVYSTCSTTAVNCWPFFYSSTWSAYQTGFAIETARQV